MFRYDWVPMNIKKWQRSALNQSWEVEDKNDEEQSRAVRGNMWVRKDAGEDAKKLA